MKAEDLFDPENATQKCLTPEVLSSELDGEYHFRPDEQEHLKHCRRCHDLYESYRILDDAVTRVLEVKCPRAASARILKNVNRRLDSLAPMNTHSHIRFSALVARIAAVAVIAAMAGYLIFIDNPYSGEIEQDTSPLPSAPAKVHPKSAATDSPVPLFPGSVDIRDLQLTAFGKGNPVRFMGAAFPQIKAEHVALIPDNVKHVWLFNSAWKSEQMGKIFRSALEKAQIPLKDVRIHPMQNGAFRVTFLLTRYQTVILTRSLAEQHLQLASPLQPQPEQNLFAGTGQETVEYEAVFIPREKA